ncbi:MAG: hypothetical protein EOO23_09455 [Comamonadaceae bacterium]|nr:MAG: hypothetical protein EOO23_09455 [Comamonadaceae bacterium]
MSFTSLIEWIDRDWANGLRAKFTLPLMVLAGWLPLSLIGFNGFTISLAAIWAVPWIALYFWRLGVWLQGNEERQRQSRKGRKR